MKASLSTINARFVRPWLTLGPQHLAEFDLSGVDFEDPEARVDYDIAVQILELGVRLSGREDLGLAGAHGDGGALRVLEYMSRASDTPLAGLQRVARHQNLIHDACLFEIQLRGDTIVLHVGSQKEGAMPPILADFFMASLFLGLFRMGVQPQGSSVTFAHPAPSNIAAFVETFRCPVTFGGQGNLAQFPRAALMVRLETADPALAAVLEVHASRMQSRLPLGDGFVDRTRSAIGQGLADGEPTMRRVAARLSVSQRTLRRRLQERGVRFQVLLDDVRAALARDYLSESDFSIEEIAFLLGFSEASAFRRAFRRWTGQSVTDSPRHRD